VVLIGGKPFAEPILMWWNFVARSRAEIDRAHAHWQAGAERFGRVDSPLPRIPAPPLVWTRRGDSGTVPSAGGGLSRRRWGRAWPTISSGFSFSMVPKFNQE
jgi:hypothetical protein